MIQKMKYVIINNGYGLECPIIFSNLIQHSQFRGLNPISAGFIKIESTQINTKIMDREVKDISIKCYGRSDSLNIESREEDSELVKNDVLKSWMF